MTNVYASKIAQIKAQLQAELAAKESKVASQEEVIETVIAMDVENLDLDTTPDEIAEFLDMMQEVDSKQSDDLEILQAQAIQAARYKKVKKYDSLLEEVWG